MTILKSTTNDKKTVLWNSPIKAQADWWSENIGGPNYRLKQVRDWIYKKGVLDPEKMGNLPGEVKKKLLGLGGPQLTLSERLVSKDGTEKLLFETHDHRFIECVVLREDGRKTLCLSTQIGCPLACRFCRTGEGGLVRNLSVAEIVEQAIRVAFMSEDRLSHIVVMGMGEPFLNSDALFDALEQVTHPDGLGLGTRHITISTSGVKGGIPRMIEEKGQYGLAVSLHASNETLRNSLMPVGKSLSLNSLLAETKEFIRVKKRRVTFEYIMLEGVNDELKHAEELARLLKGYMAHINLIPCNPVPELPYQPSSRQRQKEFKDILERTIPCTIRKEKGRDIFAACGQLAHKKLQASN